MKVSLITCKFLGRPQKRRKKSSSTTFIINFHSNKQLRRLKRSVSSTDKLFSCLQRVKHLISTCVFAIYSFIKVYYFILLCLMIPQKFCTRCKPVFWKKTAKCTGFFMLPVCHRIIPARNNIGHLCSCFYILLQSTATLS